MSWRPKSQNDLLKKAGMSCKAFHFTKICEAPLYVSNRSDEPPMVVRGIRHNIDLQPSTKYCVLRQLVKVAAGTNRLRVLR